VLGYLTAWAAGEDLPLAAALNAAGGQMKSSAAIVPAGVGGDISMFSSDTTAAAIDINGYFSPSDPNGLAFYPTPTCILGMFGAYTGYTLNIPVNDPCGAPSNAAAYSINARVWQDDGTLPGSLTIWPEGQQHPDLPTASTSPFEYYVDKSALVPAGWSGGLSVLTTDEIEFWILVHGYFGPPGPGGLFFYPLRPCRLEDTRQREGFQLLEASYFHVDATAKGCGVPDNADALALNVTVLSGGAGTQARLYSSLQSANFWELQTYQGRIANNMGIVQTSGGTFYVNTPGFTHVVIDVSGYFAP
jgi:hypothetical protein